MSKNVKRIILSDKMPNNKHIAWAEPLGSEKINLKLYKDKKWISIGSSSSIDMSKAIMINAETDFEALKETIGISTANKLGIDTSNGSIFDNMTQEEYENFKETYAEEALALGLTTENHGKVVETVYDSGTDFIRMLCEDGFIIRPYGNPIELREIPPRERYAWISYEVKDAFYNNIVPKHVVHNLTDTIVKYDNSSSMYYIYNLASYNPYFRSTDRTSQVTVDESTQVSLWIGHVYDNGTDTFVVDNITLSVGDMGGGAIAPS